MFDGQILSTVIQKLPGREHVHLRFAAQEVSARYPTLGLCEDGGGFDVGVMTEVWPSGRGDWAIGLKWRVLQHEHLNFTCESFVLGKGDDMKTC